MSKKPPEPVKGAPIKLERGRLTVGVPDHIKIAIADAIIEFSGMEGALEVFIWEITGLAFDDGRVLTKQDISMKIKIARGLSEKHKILAPSVPKGATTMWRAMADLLPVRNLIAHGMWAMIDLQIPVSVSYRIPSDPDQIAGDSFPLERLQAVSRQCAKIRECLDRMISAAHTWRSRPSAPHRKKGAIPTPLPQPPKK